MEKSIPILKNRSKEFESGDNAASKEFDGDKDASRVYIATESTARMLDAYQKISDGIDELTKAIDSEYGCFDAFAERYCPDFHEYKRNIKALIGTASIFARIDVSEKPEN